jgi:hypothetical protein
MDGFAEGIDAAAISGRHHGDVTLGAWDTQLSGKPQIRGVAGLFLGASLNGLHLGFPERVKNGMSGVSGLSGLRSSA